MMNCEKYFDSIDDLVEGELDEQIALQMNSHIFACPKCLEHYESLKREKEIYAQFLFEAEPPKHLWNSFQARLEAEKTSGVSVTPPLISARKTNLFGFWRWSPALALAALLAIFGIGFGWSKFAPVEKNADKFIVQAEPNDLRQTTRSGKADDVKNAESRAEINSDENVAAPKNNKSLVKTDFIKASRISSAGKTFAAENVRIKQKTVSASERKNSANGNRLIEEERLQKLQAQNLEQEIAGQIEKIELLMRSFRNARTIESGGTFDIEYEKRQARRLLEKNVRLRRDAENYGIFYAEELLGRVEPYLLDIANLDTNPAADKVLDIRERVSNQSIIASLQVY
jgi:hypothetical protein